ncbi:MAG: winged helix-turn-helix domain-containing protein [Candidatus Aenigmarchaeota archaeon]|nr:winged helix-turn-helix domain-containing protein [Candidatus Aenigmarchaeota archaeon]
MDSTHFFGKYAGKVWKVLNSRGPKTLTQLQKASGLTLKEASIGLGWLAREGKIKVIKTGNLQMKFELCE